MQLYTPVVGIPVALFAVSVHRAGHISTSALLASFLPILLAAASTLRTPRHPEGSEILISTAILLLMSAVGAWSLGRISRSIQRNLDGLERERVARREADVVATDRGRIARELSDIHHTLTMILLQAARADRVADTDFSQITLALARIETTGKQTMTELRHLFGALEASDHCGDATGSGYQWRDPAFADLNNPYETKPERRSQARSGAFEYDLDRSVGRTPRFPVL
jgi:signal transduction histidine kinase